MPRHREENRDRVAPSHAQPCQPARCRRDFVAELAEVELFDGPVFTLGADREPTGI